MAHDGCDGCAGTIYPESETITLCRDHLRERDSDALHRGVRIAAKWIREMPPRALVESKLRVGHEVYQRVAHSVARYLDDRIDTADEVTRPSLPPSSG